MKSFKQTINAVERFATDNSPLLLTTVGSAGVVATAVLSSKATVKALDILNEAEESREFYGQDGFTPREKLELTWQCYIPPAIAVASTCAAIISANQIGARRAAAVAAAYSVTEKMYDEYREKVREKFGERQETEVLDSIQKDRVARAHSDEVVVIGTGDHLCFDSYSGRFFNSSMEQLKSATNRVNYQIIHDNYASLSDFYAAVGLPPTKMSDDVGWNVDRLLDIRFSTVLSPDGKPAISMDFVVVPIRDYFRIV